MPLPTRQWPRFRLSRQRPGARRSIFGTCSILARSGAGKSPRLDKAFRQEPAEPSLPGLFPPTQIQAKPELQAELNKPTHMFKVHKTLGVTTAIPMVTALVTDPQGKAKGRNGQTVREPTEVNQDLRIALGGLTTGLYWTTAYYAISAPKVPGAIRLRRDLAWVQISGMILTGILGIMAYRQKNAGENVHEIASAHGAVAYVTAAAHGVSIVSVSWPIHIKFWR